MKTTVHYRAHKSVLRVPILSYINPVHSLQSYFFQKYFNIILTSTPRSSKLSLQVSSQKLWYVSLTPPYVLNTFHSFSLSWSVSIQSTLRIPFPKQQFNITPHICPFLSILHFTFAFCNRNIVHIFCFSSVSPTRFSLFHWIVMHFLLFIIFGPLSFPKYKFISEIMKCRHLLELRRQGIGLLACPLMCRIYQAQR